MVGGLDRIVEQIVEQGILYDFYGPLLTAHQREIYEMVVYQDYSLNEIAEKTNVSKQAVSDLIRRVNMQLSGYENKLGLVAKFLRISEECDELDQAVDHLLDGEEAKKIHDYTKKIRDIM